MGKATNYWHLLHELSVRNTLPSYKGTRRAFHKKGPPLGRPFLAIAVLRYSRTKRRTVMPSTERPCSAYTPAGSADKSRVNGWLPAAALR